jgi:hypothetical protein
MKWNYRVPLYRLVAMLTGGLLLLPVGCGFFENAGTVSGSVRYKEQPLNEGTVSFITEKGEIITGSIDKSGRYSVAHVPLGPVKITVQVFNAAAPPLSYVAPKKSQMAEKSDKIPLRFSMAATSGLRHTVTKGKQAFDIELQ